MCYEIKYCFIFKFSSVYHAILVCTFCLKFYSYIVLYCILCHFQISALFVMTIGLYFLSSRTAIMIGGTLIATANIINALSTDIGILFASFGVIEGTRIHVWICGTCLLYRTLKVFSNIINMLLHTSVETKYKPGDPPPLPSDTFVIDTSPVMLVRLSSYYQIKSLFSFSFLWHFFEFAGFAGGWYFDI